MARLRECEDRPETRRPKKQTTRRDRAEAQAHPKPDKARPRPRTLAGTPVTATSGSGRARAQPQPKPTKHNSKASRTDIPYRHRRGPGGSAHPRRPDWSPRTAIAKIRVDRTTARNGTRAAPHSHDRSPPTTIAKMRTRPRAARTSGTAISGVRAAPSRPCCSPESPP